MAEYKYLRSDGTYRELIFWSSERDGGVIARLDDWTGYDDELESIDIEGSTATVVYNGGKTAIFELKTGSNIAEKK